MMVEWRGTLKAPNHTILFVIVILFLFRVGILKQTRASFGHTCVPKFTAPRPAGFGNEAKADLEKPSI